MNEQLVTDNLGLVHHMVHKYAKYNENNYMDYFQSGCFGLVLAAQRYDETQGVQFNTFVANYIRGYIKRQYSDIECSPLHIPVRELYYESGESVIPVCASLSEVIGEEITVEDVIPDETDTIGDLISALDFAEFIKAELNEREKAVIKLTMQGEYQNRISEIMGISGALVNRSMNRIRKKLTEHIAKNAE